MVNKVVAKGYIRKIKCPACKGKGYLEENLYFKCPACKGKGYLEEKVTIADATFEDQLRCGRIV